jgi:hypothetical protein
VSEPDLLALDLVLFRMKTIEKKNETQPGLVLELAQLVWLPRHESSLPVFAA